MLLWVEHRKMEEIFTSLKLKLGSLLFHIINLMAYWPFDRRSVEIELSSDINISGQIS